MSNHRLSACCRFAGASIKTKEVIGRTSCDVEFFNVELFKSKLLTSNS